MRNYVNIDALERAKRNRFSLKRSMVILGLSAGIGAAAFSTVNKVNDNGPRQAQEYTMNEDVSKVFKSYEIKSGDTLDSIVNKVMEEYPETANHYTTQELINEVVKSNHLAYSGDKITAGNYIIIPYYISTKVIEEREDFYNKNKEAAEALEEYEEYRVKFGDSYWKIAYMYTSDDNEIVKLVRRIQELNDYESLKANSTITIPNIEKYKLLHEEYEEDTKASKINL